MSSAAETIALALGGHRSGAQWIARCPAHDDRTPSLAIRDGTAPGRIVLHCYAGCDYRDVAARLREMGLLDELAPKDGAAPLPRANGHAPAVPGAPAPSADTGWTALMPVPPDTPRCDFARLLGAEPTAFWDYLDAQGRLLGYVARLDGPDGKRILPITYCVASNGTRAWRLKAFREPRPLYGLPELVARLNAPVLVVEGEKAAVAALFDDHVTVTWPGGAKSVKSADWTPLRSRNVTLWPDNDEPGRAAMRDVAVALSRVGAASIRVATLPDGLPQGWDLADEVPPGLDVRALLDTARYVRQESAEGEAENDARPLDLVDPTVFDGVAMPPREFLVPDWIGIGHVTGLLGPDGVGKSLAGLQLQVAAALRLPWFDGAGMEPLPTCSSVGIYTEDDGDELHRRLARILDHHHGRFEDLGGRMRFLSLVGQDPFLVRFDGMGVGTPTRLFEGLRAALFSFRPRLLVLDHLAALVAGNLNDAVTARQAVALFAGLALELRAAVLLIGHPSRSGMASGEHDGYSVQVSATMRARLSLSRPPENGDSTADPDARILTRRKANYSGTGELRLLWRDGVLVGDVESRAAAPRGIVDKIDLDARVLAALGRLVHDGCRVAADPAARTSLPKRLRKEREFGAHPYGVLVEAQRRLREAGRIVMFEDGPPSRRYAFLRPSPP